MNGASKTRLVYKANLNFKVMERYLRFLNDRNMIQLVKEGDGRDRYLITQRGREFLLHYSQVEDMLNLVEQSSLHQVTSGNKQDMPHVDDFLTPLKDGKWHNIEEIQKKVNSGDEKFNEALEFLLKYDIVQIEGKRMKAAPDFISILEAPIAPAIDEGDEPSSQSQSVESLSFFGKEVPLELRTSALVVRGKIGTIKLVQGELSVSGSEIAIEMSPTLSSQEIALTVLKVILDGEWHSYEDIAKQLSISEDEVRIGLGTLADS